MRENRVIDFTDGVEEFSPHTRSLAGPSDLQEGRLATLGTDFHSPSFAASALKIDLVDAISKVLMT